ncbi:MAG: PAS domain S-box protein [Deltaproteobacteria bacterium]|nr:PAS domain S-box protein [Deltaproteobacteria bacterium]MBW2117250.1 PAS domain S-box protein [Deltaproteobacteria bacterium]MBW2342911.1 PAS domain S-box protein [Deltaproteobacteria bacterium]
MSVRQQQNLENRVEKLKDQNLTLREKLNALKKENKSLEKALRDSLNLLKDIPGSVVLIQDGKIVLMNETARDQLGYAEEEILGRNFLDFIHPDSVEYVKNLHRRRILGKPVPDDYETYLITKSGDELCCEVQVKKIRYQGRTAFLFNITGLDQRKQKEMRLLHSRKMEALTRMATGLNREFNRFLSMLDEHDLYAQGIESATDKDLIRSLRKIEAARERGNFIIEQLSCLTMTENERSDITLLDLKKTVQDIVAMTRPKWKEDLEDRGVGINVKTYLRALSPVEACPHEIQDALLSIMLNAIDALPAGGEIYLTTEENAGFAHVYVQDNGVGIKDDIKDKIFDPFFTTRGDSRLGLGLSLAYAIINRHKGEIEVMSQEGQGATFTIKLPLAPEPPPSKAKGPKKRIRDSNILIIADGGIVKDLLSQLLVSKGGKVANISTDMECLKLLRKNRFDLVIADLDTPYLNAPVIIPKIKNMDKSLAVALVNAPEEKGRSRKLKNLGADLIIGRPLNMDKALSLISGVLATRSKS